MIQYTETTTVYFMSTEELSSYLDAQVASENMNADSATSLKISGTSLRQHTVANRPAMTIRSVASMSNITVGPL